MHLSFLELSELIKETKDVKEENLSKEAIRSGLIIDEDFWSNFIEVCGNADAIAELFELPKFKVTAWAEKITNLIEEVEKEDSIKNKKSDRSIMLKTGDGNEKP